MTEEQYKSVEGLFKGALEACPCRSGSKPSNGGISEASLPDEPNAKYAVVDKDGMFKMGLYDARVSQPYEKSMYGVIPSQDGCMRCGEERNGPNEVVFNCRVGAYSEKVVRVSVAGIKGRGAGTWETEVPVGCCNSMGRSYSSGTVEGVYFPEKYGSILGDYMEMVDDWTHEYERMSKAVAKNAKSAMNKCGKLGSEGAITSEKA